MLLSPLGLFHEFFRFIFVFFGLNIRLMTHLEQPRPTTQTCFTSSLRPFPQASVLSFRSIESPLLGRFYEQRISCTQTTRENQVIESTQKG